MGNTSFDCTVVGDIDWGFDYRSEGSQLDTHLYILVRIRIFPIHKECTVVFYYRVFERTTYVIAKTSPRNVGDLVFRNNKRAKLSSFKTNAWSSSFTKSKMKIPGIYIFLVLRYWKTWSQTRIRGRTKISSFLVIMVLKKMPLVEQQMFASPNTTVNMNKEWYSVMSSIRKSLIYMHVQTAIVRFRNQI